MPAQILEGPVEDLRRSQLVLGFSICLSLVGFLVPLTTGQPMTSPSMLLLYGMSVVGLCNIALLRVTGTHVHASALMCFYVFLATGLNGMFTGGLSSPIFAWNLYVLMIAAFLLGLRWGALFVALSLLELLGLYLMNRYQLAPPVKVFMAPSEKASTLAFLVAFGLPLAWLYESSRTRALVALKQQTEENRQIALDRDAAELANQATTRFLANMSHELRTPLNAIIGYAELLAEDAQELEGKELLPDIEKIRTSGHHLLGLIDDLLDVSDIDVDNVRLHMEPLSMAELVEQVVDSFRPIAAKRHNDLQLEFDEGLPPLRSDRRCVQRCIRHLMSNACKFTEEGSIALRVVRVAQGVELEVEDTGIGISPAQQARLFERFAQGDSSSTRRYGGTGLGLAISKRLCQLLGGDLSLVSQEGKGTCVTMRLPLEPS